jgi:AraC-like DNA-binding protein
MTKPLLPLARAESDAGAVVIAVERTEELARVTASHRHARGQLLGARRGLVTVLTDVGQWVVPATHAAWIPPRQAHGLRSHGPFAGWSAYVAEAACAAMPAAPCTVRVSGLLREALRRATSWEPAVPATNAERERRARLEAVILDEIAGAQREPLGLPMPRDPRLARIARGLVERPDDERSLAAWARAAGLSARTATRRFVAETGFSFTSWRQRARLLKALELLAEEMPVTSVALELGYRNPSAFIALFRRTFGVTPTSYFARLDGTPQSAASS